MILAGVGRVSRGGLFEWGGDGESYLWEGFWCCRF